MHHVHGAGAVSAHPADLRVSGPLPRERSDGRLREGVRLLERRDRIVPVGAAAAGRRRWASCGWSRATEQKKLYDIHDVAVSVAANSQNGDVTGELVDVGLGTRADDYAGKDLKGKVAIGSGGVGQIFALASERGAIGAVGYSTLYPDRGVDVIPSSSIAVNAAGLRLGRLAAPGARAGRAPRARREGVAPLGDQGRDDAGRAGDGARDDRRRSGARPRTSSSPAISTRGISSRAPTTTTPAAR